MEDSIKIYSSASCPKCRMLKMALQKKDIAYEEETDVNVMASLNIKKIPTLSVNGQFFSLQEAMKWLEEK